MNDPPIRPEPAKIIVPRKHAQILVEPPFAALTSAGESGKGRRGESASGAAAKIADSPVRRFAGSRSLESLRTAARAQFLQAAADWANQIHAAPPPDDALEKPWIITGHQVEFYHAGVWAKVVAADHLARSTGGVAFDLLVDHDTVDHLGFDVPERQGGGGDSWKRIPIQWAPASTIPADGLAAPTAEQFAAWQSTLAQHPLANTDTLRFLVEALDPTQSKIENRKSKISYAPWLSAARTQLERSLDIGVHHIPTSLVCTGDTWRTFISAWIDNAEAWTAAYNRHLAAYRKAHGIKNPHHPMPDLARTTQGATITYELPFWIYKPGEPRQRLFIRKSPAGTTLLHDAGEYPLPTDFGFRISDLVIRPRALTLTMYVRLFLADLFIHGIGGALYDQITDGLMEELFHEAGGATPYGCVSAAWLLPLGQPLENSIDIPALRSRRHHLLHNPQLALDPAAMKHPATAQLLATRKTLLEEITASLAAARKDKSAIADRREWFDQLHATNQSLQQQFPRILADLDHQIQVALRAREQNKVLLWREYFFGLHTTDSLRQLIAKVRTAGDP